VNNVESGAYGPFLGLSAQEATDVFVLNCLPVTLLTRKVIPHMLERLPTKSAIINMGSQLSEVNLPERGLYCATKRYADYFSRSISDEFEGRIDVLSFR
jgi:short-subunit dehydrogenase